MKALNYAAGAAAAVVLWAGAAQAVTVDYTGLAFNRVSGPFSFSAAVSGPTPAELLLGPNMNQAADLGSGLGQAVYSVDVPDEVADDGSMAGGTITFGAATKAITFSPVISDPMTMWITGGSLDILPNNGPNPEAPVVTLPFGFGTADPDYELSGYLETTINGEAITLSVCSEAAAIFFYCYSGFDADDRPWNEEVGPQPYNTLNVGDDAGDKDLAMFLYLYGQGADKYYETEYGDWSNWEYVQHCDDDNNSDTYRCDVDEEWYYDQQKKKWKKKYVYKEKTREATVTEVEFCKTWKDGCHKQDGEEYFVKLALWGEGPGDEVPEPATLSMLGLGLIGLGAASTRRRRKAA